MGDETAVISIQNGMDPQERLITIVGREHVMGGATYITGAKVMSPGVITHTGSVARLVYGECDGSLSSRGERFLNACKKAGIDALFSTNVTKEMWAKFALLSAFSGVSTMLPRAVGSIMSNPETRKLLRDAIAETVAVAKAKGIDAGHGQCGSAILAPSPFDDLQRTRDKLGLGHGLLLFQTGALPGSQPPTPGIGAEPVMGHIQHLSLESLVKIDHFQKEPPEISLRVNVRLCQ